MKGPSLRFSARPTNPGPCRCAQPALICAPNPKSNSGLTGTPSCVGDCSCPYVTPASSASRSTLSSPLSPCARGGYGFRSWDALFSVFCIVRRFPTREIAGRSRTRVDAWAHVYPPSLLMPWLPLVLPTDSQDDTAAVWRFFLGYVWHHVSLLLDVTTAVLCAQHRARARLVKPLDAQQVDLHL